MVLYKNIAINYLVLFVGKILQFFIIILISKKISVIDFGYYSFFINLISLAVIISLLGIPIFINYKISLLKNNKKKLIKIFNYQLNVIIISGLLFFISISFIYIYYKNIFIDGNVSFFWFSLFAYILILFTIINSALHGLKKVNQASLNENITKNCLLVILFFFFSDFTVNSIFKSYFFSYLLTFIIILIYVLKYFTNNIGNIKKLKGFTFNFLGKNSKKLLSQSAAIEILTVLFSFMPIFLTQKYLTIDKLGIYNFAFLISTSALIFIFSISASTFPIIASYKSENKTKEILKLVVSLRFINVIFMLIFIPFFLLIYNYFLIFFGNSLHIDARKYISLFLLSHLVLSFFSLSTNLLFIHNYQAKIIRNYLISILIVLPISPYLMSNFSLVGSVLIYLFLTISFAIINEITVCKIFKRNIFFHIFLFKKNFKYLNKILVFIFYKPSKKIKHTSVK
jgi:O-antigen/teichoic acid export membrane protein